MSKAIKTVAVLTVALAISACAKERNAVEEIVIVEPAPIVMEPVSNKY